MQTQFSSKLDLTRYIKDAYGNRSKEAFEILEIQCIFKGCCSSNTNFFRQLYLWQNYTGKTKNLQGKDGRRQLLYYVNLIRACEKVLYQLVDVVAKVYRRIMYTLAPNFEANV